jgi:hypothetical protein
VPNVAKLTASQVTIAILSLLQTDLPLRALLSDGAWFAEAPPGSQQFVIVQLLSSLVAPGFGGPAFKDATYLVEARALSTTGADVNAAYARIVELLTDAALALDGYAPMLVQFEEDVEMVEVDSVDPSIRWDRCGGHLHVMVAPLV